MFNSFKKWIQTTVEDVNLNILPNDLTTAPATTPTTTTPPILHNEYGNGNGYFDDYYVNSRGSNSSSSSSQRRGGHNSNLLKSPCNGNGQISQSNSRDYIRSSVSNTHLRSSSNLTLQQSSTESTLKPARSAASNISQSLPQSPNPSSSRRPSATATKIDLSHLSVEEQAHIAAVLERAKVEEYEIDSQSAIDHHDHHKSHLIKQKSYEAYDYDDNQQVAKSRQNLVTTPSTSRSNSFNFQQQPHDTQHTSSSSSNTVQDKQHGYQATSNLKTPTQTMTTGMMYSSKQYDGFYPNNTTTNYMQAHSASSTTPNPINKRHPVDTATPSPQIKVPNIEINSKSPLDLLLESTLNNGTIATTTTAGLKIHKATKPDTTQANYLQTRPSSSSSHTNTEKTTVKQTKVNKTASNTPTVTLSASSSSSLKSNHFEDDSFITYANKEIEHLERTMLNMPKTNKTDNNIHPNPSHQQQHLRHHGHSVPSNGNDEDEDDDETGIFVCDLNKKSANEGTTVGRITSAAKFHDEFKLLSEQRISSKDSVNSDTALLSCMTLKSKRKLPIAPDDTPSDTPTATTITATASKESKVKPLNLNETSGLLHTYDQTAPVSPNPKLENVAEWLSRSFDRIEMSSPVKTSSSSSSAAATTTTVTLGKSKLSDTKQRQCSEDSERYTVTSDELVEINLSDFTPHSKQQQQQQIESIDLKSNQVLVLSNGLLGVSHLSHTKSHNSSTITLVDSHSQENLSENESNTKSVSKAESSSKPQQRGSKVPSLQETLIEHKVKSPPPPVQPVQPADDPSIKRISLYKDPKDDGVDSLGIRIAARQKIPDLKKDLAAIVSHIIPNGLVQKFDLPINVGDEVFEINNFNLRNKTNEEICDILNKSCENSNGEIEIVVRTTPQAIVQQRRHHLDDGIVDELQSFTSSVGTFDQNRSSPSARSSITSSPVSSSDHATTNQRFNAYASDNQSIRKPVKTESPVEFQIPRNKPCSIPPKSSSFNSDQGNGNTTMSRVPPIRPLVKISAPPPDVDPDNFEENIFINSSTVATTTTTTTSARVTQRSSSSNPSVNNTRSRSPITSHPRGHAAPIEQHHHQTKRQNASRTSDNEHRDSISSNASGDVSAVRQYGVNSGLLKNSKTQSLGLDSSQDSQRRSSLQHRPQQSQRATNSTLSPEQNTATDTHNHKHMLVSASMSSITSARKLSNESCQADVESDNLSKYFPSSRENSRRNSKEHPVVVTNSNGATELDDSVTSELLLNQLENSLSSQTQSQSRASSSFSLSDEKQDGRSRSKSKISFKFSKQQQPSKTENLERRKNDVDALLLNSDAPYGELQLQIGHSEIDEQINVKLIKARNLLPKDANGFSDPFVKVYLLPGRDQDNKRRTKPILKNLNPEWNYTVVYPHVHKEELKYKTLEFTVWDYDRFKSNDFLGKVTIDLSDSKHLDNKPRWYKLKGQFEEHDHLDDSSSNSKVSKAHETKAQHN